MADLKKKAKKRRKSFSFDEASEHHQTIFSLIRNQTQIDFSNYKLTTVGRRIQRQMKLHKIEDVEDYVAYLESKPEAVRLLCDDVFIHVTEFFRDPESYTALKKRIYPRLIKNRHPGAPLRIWVPGCSTGEEAYSIAISLLEFLEKENLKVPFQVFATDISEQAVQKARYGAYSEHEIESVPLPLRNKYFDKVKEGYRIQRSVRDLFVFSRHDLTSNPPFAKMDLISCRNVLIYFAPALQRQVMPVFHYALNRDGFLWLGKSESPVGISKLFSLTETAHKIFSKINTASPLSIQGVGFPHMAPLNEYKKSKPAQHQSLDFQKEFDRIVVSRYAPSGVVVNSGLEILQLRGDNSPYLVLTSGQPSYNLLKLLRPELLPGVRMAFQAAQKQNCSIRKEGLGYEVGKERRKVSVEIIPFNLHLPPKERQYVILFDETKANLSALQPRKKAKKMRVPHLASADESYVAELLEDIDGMRDYQQALAEGYEAAQEELTTSNEKLQSSIEEFQSTNEELETAKEELQASNEELTTLNDELQKRNEELLTAIEAQARSEEKFRLLITAVKDYAIFMLDLDGAVATWNEGAERIKGYASDEIVGQHFSIFYLAEEKRINDPAKILEVAAREGHHEDEGWRLKKNGERFWASVSITRIADESGKPLGFSMVIRDLTERKKTEDTRLENQRKSALLEQVRENARTLDQIFSQSPSFMCLTLGPKHIYERANQKYLETLNLSSAILGHEVLEVLPDLKAQGFIELLDEAYATGVTCRKNESPLQLKDADGKKERLVYLDFAYQPLRNQEGQVYGLVHQGFDVTEKVQSRKAVENERENFRNLFRQTPEMVCILRGPEHTFEFVNDAHIKALGFDATGLPVRTAQPESVEVHGILDEVYRTGKTAELHEIPVTLTDRLRYFNLTYAARRDDAGKINGIMILGVEVTDQVMARNQIQEALRTRDEFVSIASHELKTPLTSLKMELQIVQRRTRPEINQIPSPAELAESLALSLKQIDSLTNLVDDLLDISRIRAGKFSLNLAAVDLADIVSDSVKRFAEPLNSAHNEMRIELDSVVGEWDERRLYQVLVNLISNSIKYAPAAPITITLRQKGDRAQLRFSDQGPGIPKDKQPAIFDRFERANASHNVGGLGLGLFIVKSIIEAHQGTIRIEGDVGGGTTFLIELPLRPFTTTEREMTYGE